MATPRRAGGHRPAQRRGAGAGEQAHLRPNLFVEGIDGKLAALNESIDKPLLNRALRGTYPPGSTYKPFMALAALETGKRTPSAITRPGSWTFGGHTFRSHDHGLGAWTCTAPSSIEQHLLLQLANDMGVDAIHDFMKPLGFGQITGIDLQGEVRGVLPSRMEAQHLQAPRAEEVVRRARRSRWALARATTTSPCCSWPWPGHAGQRGTRYQPHLGKAMVDAVSRETTALPQVPGVSGLPARQCRCSAQGHGGVTQAAPPHVFLPGALPSGARPARRRP
jgi:penicillin-binding protein 2